MSTLQSGVPTPLLDASVRSRRSGVAAGSFIALAALVWGSAEALRAADFPERTAKGWCSLGVVVAALAQLALISFAAARRSADPLAAMRLRTWHRRVGVVTLGLAGFITYLCFTGPFPGGATLHRITGYTICATVLAKVAVVSDRPHHRRVIGTFGAVLLTGFVIAFVTKGWPALVGDR